MIQYKNLSSTLCSNAFTDLNIDFYNKRWRYCCKSVSYPIPEKFDANYFVNNEHKLKQQNDLFLGIQTESCSECWKDYKNTGTAWRDIANQWEVLPFEDDSKIKISHKLAKHIEPIDDYKSRYYYPHHLVLTFDNICDQSCIYCGPHNSTKWEQELKKNSNTININDIIVNFVSWINNNLVKHLEKKLTIQVLGGEPTYSKNFYFFLDELKKYTWPKKLTISITSNLNTNEPAFKRLEAYIEDLPFDWQVGVSNESYEKIAENIRYGLKIKNFERNLANYTKLKKVSRIIFAPTMNAFNVKNFEKYIEFVHGILKKNNKNQEFIWIGNWVDNNPDQLDCKYLPNNFIDYIEDSIKTMKKTMIDINVDKSQEFLIFDWLDNMKKRILSSNEDLPKIKKYLKYLKSVKPYLNDTLLLKQLTYDR